MYGHGFATLFLAEVYGMSPNEELHGALEKAVKLIVDSQNEEGGWRYFPVTAIGGHFGDGLRDDGPAGGAERGHFRSQIDGGPLPWNTSNAARMPTADFATNWSAGRTACFRDRRRAWSRFTMPVFLKGRKSSGASIT